MTDPETTSEALSEKAARGDDKAMSALLARHEGDARRVVRMLVGQPDDVNDVMQETMLAAFTGLADKQPDADFGGWFRALAVEHSMAFLALQRPWRLSAQLMLEDLVASHDLAQELAEAMDREGFAFDAGEHVAFCYQAVSRSLPLQQQVALTLEDVLGFGLPAAAAATKMREADVRRYRDDGFAALTKRFESLCSLVNDEAPCHHCQGLRACAPEGARGTPAEDLPLHGPDEPTRLSRRLRVVRQADLDRGPTRALHDLQYKLMAQNEALRDTPAQEDDKLPAGHFGFDSLLAINN